MTTSLVIEGKQFSFDGDTIEFFGTSGHAINERQWQFCFDNGDPVTSEPDSIKRQLDRAIDRQFANNRGAQTHMLMINPLQAVVFFLEGGIPKGKLDHAEGCEDQVDIPGIRINGKTVTLRVVPDLTAITAADFDGNPLP